MSVRSSSATVMVRPAARYPHCGNRALFRCGPPIPRHRAAGLKRQRQRAGFHVQQLEGCCRVAGRGKGFAGLHLPAPQLNHIRPGGAGGTGAAPAGLARGWGSARRNNMQRGFACHIDNIRYRYAQRGGEFAEDRNAGIGGLFSISTSIPLLMLARRDSSSSDIFSLYGRPSAAWRRRDLPGRHQLLNRSLY